MQGAYGAKLNRKPQTFSLGESLRSGVFSLPCFTGEKNAQTIEGVDLRVINPVVRVESFFTDIRYPKRALNLDSARAKQEDVRQNKGQMP